ncbi:hypothetical protein GQX74_015639 [Glossina fuscipes]|nr:hypothetical protein GQX74_015639 [Glossina fuscipes]
MIALNSKIKLPTPLTELNVWPLIRRCGCCANGRVVCCCSTFAVVVVAVEQVVLCCQDDIMDLTASSMPLTTQLKSFIWLCCVFIAAAAAAAAAAVAVVTAATVPLFVLYMTRNIIIEFASRSRGIIMIVSLMLRLMMINMKHMIVKILWCYIMMGYIGANIMILLTVCIQVVII